MEEPQPPTKSIFGTLSSYLRTPPQEKKTTSIFPPLPETTKADLPSVNNPNVLNSNNSNVLNSDNPNVLNPSNSDNPNVMTSNDPNVLNTDIPNVLNNDNPNVLNSDNPNVLNPNPNVLNPNPNNPDQHRQTTVLTLPNQRDPDLSTLRTNAELRKKTTKPSLFSNIWTSDQNVQHRAGLQTSMAFSPNDNDNRKNGLLDNSLSPVFSPNMLDRKSKSPEKDLVIDLFGSRMDTTPNEGLKYLSTARRPRKNDLFSIIDVNYNKHLHMNYETLTSHIVSFMVNTGLVEDHIIKLAVQILKGKLPRPVGPDLLQDNIDKYGGTNVIHTNGTNRLFVVSLFKQAALASTVETRDVSYGTYVDTDTNPDISGHVNDLNITQSASKSKTVSHLDKCLSSGQDLAKTICDIDVFELEN